MLNHIFKQVIKLKEALGPPMAPWIKHLTYSLKNIKRRCTVCELYKYVPFNCYYEKGNDQHLKHFSFVSRIVLILKSDSLKRSSQPHTSTFKKKKRSKSPDLTC